MHTLEFTNKFIHKFFSSRTHFGRNLSAFTLADMLITIVIIGIVCALTMPTVVTNVNKAVTAGKIKKVYSSLSQTTYRAISQHGKVQQWEIDDTNNRASAEKFANMYMLPYLHVSKICTNNQDKDCTFNDRRLLNGKTYTNDVIVNSKAFRFYMNDGTLISMTATNNHSTTGHNKLVRIAFDINGQKKPNVIGKDVFIIEYMVETFKYPEINGKMLPQYGNRERDELIQNNAYMCNKKQSGEACLALIYKDGWEITKDYPW